MHHHLIEILKQEHQETRSFFNDLKSEIKALDPQKDGASCLEKFLSLGCCFYAHLKAEESSLYCLLKNCKKAPAQEQIELLNMSLEGCDAHIKIKQILFDLAYSIEIQSEAWKVKFDLLIELVNEHFKKEETVYFPRISGYLSKEQWEDLATIYINERNVLAASALENLNRRLKG